MSYERAVTRRGERQQLQLPVEVQCRESSDFGWTRTAELLDVTPFGARLRIPHPTEPGRLIQISLPMPRELRCYDHNEERYVVWALVRHIKSIDGETDRAPQCEIGVAFVGKEPPPGFEEDPSRRYNLQPPDSKDNLWKVEGAADKPETEDSRERRTEERHKVEDDILIEVYDADGNVISRELAKTENISRHGMSVLTTLNIVRGRYVRVRSAYYKMAVIAAVRRLRRCNDGSRHLHLEFVDQQWPPLE
ncbi:MAG TPA: PilZ domain-containing protein [Pyrinomonadaceae bacterium]|nr:PilZ domain-containing protein [Pyrinomonadaceae bacterium]